MQRIVFISIIYLTCLGAFADNGRVVYADFVDTRVGTAPSESPSASVFGKKTEVLGQTIPAVLTPHGMNFWTPQTRDTEHKCVAPYYYLDDELQGFRNSHWITGGCTQDYGSMTLMPLFGTLRCHPTDRAVRFNHYSEIARPDYYSVDLPSEGIVAEMTATSRAAIFRFTYEKEGKAFLVVNPNSDEGRGKIWIDTLTNTIYGYNPVHRIYQGKGLYAGFDGFFVVKPDHIPLRYGCYEVSGVLSGTTEIGDADSIGCWLEFDVAVGECITVKAASSFTDIEAALANLQTEIPHWDFDATRKGLADTWQSHLGTIEVNSDNTDELGKFYGSLYRCSFLPHEVNDVDGAHCAFSSGEVVRPNNTSYRYFDDFSLWDTYRAQHPLITLLHPSLSGEMMQSLVDKYQCGGWLPIFPCWNSYTAAMIGDHAIAAISDAYCKGVRNFDISTAYEAMRKNAFELPSAPEYADGKGRRALHSYLTYGFIPVEDSVPEAYHKREQVSRTLEYAFDDFALARMAQDLGHQADYLMLIDRALGHMRVINPATGYVGARHADGSFIAENPFAFSPHITEGAPCHYTWYVPHDPYGLMLMMGGEDSYVAKLDSMFSEGRYWHGNEPCHQMPFMFGYARQPWKTTRAVRHILDTEYRNTPGGLSGNDDAGQMSAWYVFSALGFYPICPSLPYYMISAPTFERAVLHLENGSVLSILASGVSDKNIYIQSVTRNNEPYPYNYLLHSDLMEGGEWVFEMSDTPSDWGTSPDACPPNLMEGIPFNLP